MKKAVFLFLISLACFQAAIAQHSVMNFSDEYVSLNHRSILLIPFEPFMFQSEINRELYKENGMEGDEISSSFAEGIDQSFRYVFKDKCDVSSFYFLEKDKRYQDLSFVFQNRKLEYVQQNITEDKSNSSIRSLFASRKSPKQEEGIHNGQVVSVEDNSQKYMKAIANDLLIDSLKRQFRTDFILFVNQLDIKNIYGSVYEMANMDYNRKVDLHYTLYSSNGEILSTGVSSTKFPATENDINTIIADYFPVLAQNIYNDLFNTGISQ